VPFQEVELHAKVAGFIRKINVDIGDRVRAGQVLATLEVPELNAQVSGAEAAVRHSQEEIALAKSEVILMAQFASFIDPLIILLAIPPGITGVILILLITHTTLNVMSLMGVIMMSGIVVSNSILIMEFTRTLRREGMPIEEAVAEACRVRLRPVLMTSLATILGMVPMALGLRQAVSNMPRLLEQLLAA
jgi:hydrophobic/amphiphilic exporter-1 (mainly G- bacteria), HAE1 family